MSTKNGGCKVHKVNKVHKVYGPLWGALLRQLALLNYLI